MTPKVSQLMIKLAPVLIGGANVSTVAADTTSSSLTFAKSAPSTIVSSRLSNTPVRLTPVVNILEGLIIWVIDQFLFMIDYCTDLVLTGQSSFDFVWSLLDNHAENIKKVGGTERAIEYQARVE